MPQSAKHPAGLGRIGAVDGAATQLRIAFGIVGKLSKIEQRELRRHRRQRGDTFLGNELTRWWYQWKYQYQFAPRKMKKPTICAKALFSQRVPNAVLWILRPHAHHSVNGPSPGHAG